MGKPPAKPKTATRTALRRPAARLDGAPKQAVAAEVSQAPEPATPSDALMSPEASATSAMAVGFVLVHTAPGQERAVYDGLRAIQEIQDVQPLFGEFDFIAKLEASDFDTLGRLLVTRVRTIPGILHTETLTRAPL